jgi:threonylcarbamoyladenosine tRNA methylthiotransferase MtaB
LQIYLESIGCRLNRGEIEQIASDLQAAGHRIVGRASQADLAILNTCAVTHAAVSDSRQRSRNLAAQGVNRVVLTGCWATLDPEAIRTLPGYLEVIPNSAKDGLVTRLKLDQVVEPNQAFQAHRQ